MALTDERFQDSALGQELARLEGLEGAVPIVHGGIIDACKDLARMLRGTAQLEVVDATVARRVRADAVLG